MKGKFITYEDGNFTGPIGNEFYVHSAGFKRILKTYLEIERATVIFEIGVTAQPPTTFDEHPFKLANLEQWLLHGKT